MSPVFKSPIAWAAVFSLPVLAFSWYIATREVDEAALANSNPSQSRLRMTVVGGIQRPHSDLSRTRLGQVSVVDGVKRPSSAATEEAYSQTFGHVTCPKVPLLTRGQNPQMDSVIEALETDRFPERLSPLHDATRFDREAWRADRRTYQGVGVVPGAQITSTSRSRLVAQYDPIPYMNVAEPGRIYDVEQPGPETPCLTNASPIYCEIVEGESVYLKVKTEALAPASFTAFSMSKFENGLNAITTTADDDGVATVSLTGVTGPATVDVVAGSPLASGTIRFQVQVVRPTIADEP